MNKRLQYINKNQGIVKSTTGDLKIVNRDSYEFSFEEILSTENELESITSNLNDNKEKLEIKEYEREADRTENTAIVCADILFFTMFQVPLTLKVLLIYITKDIFAKIGLSLHKTNFTPIGRYKDIKNLKAEISQEQVEIAEKEEKLKYMKEKINYQEFTKDENSDKSNMPALDQKKNNIMKITKEKKDFQSQNITTMNRNEQIANAIIEEMAKGSKSEETVKVYTKK